LDAACFRDLPPLLELAGPAARHMNRDPALEVAPVSDPRVLLQELPADPKLLHPMDGGIGLLDQGLGENRIDPMHRHAREVGRKILLRIGRNLDTREIRVLAYESVDFFGAPMPEAESRPRIAGVAAIFGFRRLLEHDDAAGAALFGRDRCLEGG